MARPAACATPPARSGAPRRSWTRIRTATPPARRERAASAGAASPVLPDAVSEPQDGERGDGEGQQRDPEPQPADGDVRVRRVGGEALLGRLRLVVEGGVEPLRLWQLAPDVRAYRARVVAEILARRPPRVRALEARERRAQGRQRAGRPRPSRHTLRLAEQAASGVAAAERDHRLVEVLGARRAAAAADEREALVALRAQREHTRGGQELHRIRARALGGRKRGLLAGHAEA